jgi:hypothetical protein
MSPCKTHSGLLYTKWKFDIEYHQLQISYKIQYLRFKYRKTKSLWIIYKFNDSCLCKKEQHCELTWRAGSLERHSTLSDRLFTVIERGTWVSSVGKCLDALIGTELGGGLFRDAAIRRRGAYIRKKFIWTFVHKYTDSTTLEKVTKNLGWAGSVQEHSAQKYIWTPEQWCYTRAEKLT